MDLVTKPTQPRRVRLPGPGSEQHHVVLELPGRGRCECGRQRHDADGAGRHRLELTGVGIGQSPDLPRAAGEVVLHLRDPLRLALVEAPQQSAGIRGGLAIEVLLDVVSEIDQRHAGIGLRQAGRRLGVVDDQQ